MTILDITITEDIEDIDTAAGHLKCCEQDAFFCDSAFSPEFVVESPDEACPECTHVHQFMGRCGRLSGKPHQHCPFQRKVCP